MKLRLTLATTAAFLVVLAAASIASAAAPTVSISGTTATFTDDGTNADHVVVTEAAGTVPGTIAYTFTDGGIAMSAGVPLACTPASGASITCSVPGGTGADVNLGNSPSHLDQSVRFDGTWAATQVDNSAEGGADTDTFIGSDHGKELFNGGGGADSFASRGGTDTVTYAGDTKDVYAHIDDTPDSGVGCPGAGCEGDTIDSSISNLTGGDGNDTLVGNGGINTLDGSAGNDDLDGALGNDILTGGAGSDTADYSQDGRTQRVIVNLTTPKESGQGGESDTIGTDVENVTGTDLNDDLTGNTSANVLKGMGGDDTFHGGDTSSTRAGDDFSGGAGNDTVRYDDGAHDTGVTVSLDDVANDGVSGENDNVRSDVETVYGAAGNDTFLAGNGSENFIGNGTVNNGHNVISFANLSTDVSASLATGTAASGANSYTFTDVQDLTGGKGNDTLNGNTNANAISGGPGDDLIRGAGGNDAINGGDGSDTVDYSLDNRATGVDVNLAAGTQTAHGSNTTEDSLTNVENAIGTKFADKLVGDSNANALAGLEGADNLNGAAGNDVLAPGSSGTDSDGAADVVRGGTGSDTVSYAERTTAVVITLDGVANDGAPGENDNVLNDVENAVGGSGDDTITADTGADVANTFDGGPGNDRLTSLGGNDTLIGGPGQDTVDAGAGDDTIQIADNEVDTAACGDGNDTITADPIDNVGADCENVSRVVAAPTVGTLRITDASVKEGNSGKTNMVFTVTLSSAQSDVVTVPYLTQDVTAKGGQDYTPASGTLTFNAGETSKTITVAIVGDKKYEKNETFALALGKPTGNAALTTKTYGIGTIVNDDKKPKKKPSKHHGKPSPASFTAVLAPKADHSSPFSFRVIGRIGVPSGVSAKKACTGKVGVRVTVNGKHANGKVPVSHACKYGFRFRFATAPKDKHVTFRVQFLGNKVLAKTKVKILRATAG